MNWARFIAEFGVCELSFLCLSRNGVRKLTVYFDVTCVFGNGEIDGDGFVASCISMNHGEYIKDN